MVNQLKVEKPVLNLIQYKKLIVFNICSFLLCFLSINDSYSQVVEETIQLDTITETINVIYQPTITNPSTQYQKKIAVYVTDTSKVAVEKTYIRNQLNGIYKVYYPQGRLMIKAVYANNNLNGEFTWYDEDGIIRIKGLYKNGIKHGFWAYKYKKIYGKYKNGKKNGRWYKLDANNQKVKSYYKYGKLYKGKGFETDEVITTPKDTNQIITANNDTNQPPVVKLSKEYEQVIDYLKNNAVLRKTLKGYFGAKTGDLLKFKKNYKNNVFQFAIHDEYIPLGIERFIKESNEGKIVVAKIDSIIKAVPTISQDFSSNPIESNPVFTSYETKKDAFLTVFFSHITSQLMRVEVVWNKDEKEFKSDLEQLKLIESDKKFSILLYFNEKGNLAGAEYQKD